MSTRLTDEEYDFIFSRVPRLCVDVVVKTDEGILLSLRDIEPNKGLWHLPGGMVKKGETIEGAAKRIAKKETGVDITVVSMLGYMEFPHDGYDGKDRHSVSITLLVNFAGGKLEGDFQSKEMRFFKVLPEKTHPIHGRFLKEKELLG